MHLIFSPAFDNGAALVSPHGLGIRHVGPYGLLGILETDLGIYIPEVAHTRQVLDYLECLQRQQFNGHFYKQSLEKSSAIRVAETLLQWRESLYDFGWTGQWASGPGSRLRDLAQVEAVAKTRLIPGLAQRCRTVIKRMNEGRTQVQQITVLNSTEVSPAFKDLLTILAKRGVEIVEPVYKLAPVTGDIGALQQALVQLVDDQPATNFSAANDGSIQWLQSDSGQWAARYVAELVASQPECRFAIYAPDMASELDDALRDVGLPCSGTADASSARPVLQLLPLTVQLLWKPLDPAVLLQFLTHPQQPLPRNLCYMLAEVVAREPGIAGKNWHKAEAKYFAFLETKDSQKARKQRKQLDDWLYHEQFPENDLPLLALQARLGLLRQWLIGQAEGMDDMRQRQLYQQASAQVKEFETGAIQLSSHAASTLDRATLDDLMAQVRRRGSLVTGQDTQAGHVTIIKDAGGFAPELKEGIFDTVIWLGVEENTVKNYPWYSAELDAIRREGLDVPDPATIVRRASRQALRPLLAARDRLVLVQLQRGNAAHPLLERIRLLAGKGLKPGSLQQLQNGQSTTPNTRKVEHLPLPSRSRWWQFPSHISQGFGRNTGNWSYSRLNKLLETPYEYVLNYLAVIRKDDLATMSDGPLLNGNLVHHLVEAFFEAHHDDWPTLDDETVTSWVQDNMQSLLQKEGAVLLQPGRRVEAAQLRNTASRALVQLLNQLRAADVMSVQVEKYEEAAFTDSKLLGFIDLLVTHSDGQQTVIDMKWSGFTYRREELKNNTQVQLATYAWLRKQNGAEIWPEQAYFIIRDAQLLMTHNRRFPNATVVNPINDESVAQLWKRITNTMDWRLAQLKKGKVEVPLIGFLGADPGIDSSVLLEGMLQFKDGTGVFSDYGNLVGWRSGDE